MSEPTAEYWDEYDKKLERADRRRKGLVLLNLATGTMWAFAILYAWLLYSHNELAGILGPSPVPISWTIFTYGTIANLFAIAIIVTLVNVAARYYVSWRDKELEHRF